MAVVGEFADLVDLLVVGAGPGGYEAALKAAHLGREVVLVDRDGEAGVGGICLRVGCIPSKALIEVAGAAHRVGDLSAAGLKVSGSRVDLAEWQKWKVQVVDTLTGGVRRLLAQAKVKIVAGELRLTRPNQVIVQSPDGRASFFQFEDAILATGSRPIDLPFMRRDGKQILDSTDTLALESIPASVAVIGGGYIGLELGIALAKLGSEVTVVEMLDRLLPTVDKSLLRPLQKRLQELGVSVLLSTRAKGFDGKSLEIEGPKGNSQISVEKVIVAVGRRPNTDDLGLEKANIKPGPDGLLQVAPDRRLTRNITAIGDITPGPALAHKASAEARVAAEALCGQRVAFQPAAIPAVVFSDPEIATAGLSADQAKEEGMDVGSTTIPFTASGRALTMRETNGFLQLVYDRDSRAVVGVHIVGPHASELISEGVLAIEMAASVDDVALTIHPHPTLGEQMGQVALAAADAPSAAPKKAAASAARA